MTKRLSSLLLALVLCTTSTATAQADDGVVIDGANLTNADAKVLLENFKLAMKENDKAILITIALRKPAEMPAYDPVWEYRGFTKDAATGKPSMLIWIASDQSDATLQHAIGASILDALCDTGNGGPNLKKIYDSMAAKDAALPPGSPDPFANRRKLGDALAAAILSS
jgi:hypothetical protein